MCITQSYIDLILSNRSLACTLSNQVGSLDYRIVLVPGISYTLVGTIRCKSIEGSTSLLVRTRVGCDIITLPLWVHRVGPTLCLVYSVIQCVNTCCQVIFAIEEVIWGQLSLRFLIQEVSARRESKQGCCHETTHI